MSSCENILVQKSNNKKKLPWIEKYRPKQIDQIISHQEIIMSLKKFIEMKTLPHLLFFGPSGSGKTSTIKCCAREIYGQYVDCMILELNASNERGIETVRTKIKNFVSNKNSIFLPQEIRNIFKLVILDEIDSMTVEAQGMLRQTIEKNSTTTRFCLICNDIDKINIALQSRCALFRFAPLDVKDMRKRLNTICTIEKIKYEKNALEAIIKISKGDMRAAINTLQHVKVTMENIITIENIYKISGYCMPQMNIDIFNNLLQLSEKKQTLVDCVEKITNMVIDNNITIFNLLEELKNIVIASKFTTKQKIFLIDSFAQNEVYDAVNVDSKNILMIISSIFVIVPKIK
jgi:replication factor C subunit 3/5